MSAARNQLGWSLAGDGFRSRLPRHWSEMDIASVALRFPATPAPIWNRSAITSVGRALESWVDTSATFDAIRVSRVTMAGKLFKADLLYRGSVWIRHFPDLTCVRTLGPFLVGRRRDARDDSLLLAITRAYAKAGIEICAATDFAPELLVDKGQLAGPAANERLQRDIEAGWLIAKQMGGLDIGQAITIKDGTVIAVEAIEGTDACIERTGQLCKRGGWALVKVSKPQQDMRFDVPTIGPQTIQRVQRCQGNGDRDRSRKDDHRRSSSNLRARSQSRHHHRRNGPRRT